METSTNGWQYFICPDCQQEKPLAKRRKIGRYRVGCTDCIARKAALAPKPKRQYTDYEVEVAEVPQAAIDAYAESRAD